MESPNDLEGLYRYLKNGGPREYGLAIALRTLLDTVKAVDYTDDGNTRFIFLPGLTREHVTIQRNGGELTVPGQHLLDFIRQHGPKERDGEVISGLTAQRKGL